MSFRSFQPSRSFPPASASVTFRFYQAAKRQLERTLAPLPSENRPGEDEEPWHVLDVSPEDKQLASLLLEVQRAAAEHDEETESDGEDEGVLIEADQADEEWALVASRGTPAMSSGNGPVLPPPAFPWR